MNHSVALAAMGSSETWPADREPQTADAPECTLVVPIYRNEQNVPSLLAAIDMIARQVGPDRFEAVFVVDGSPDRSLPMLRDALRHAAFRARLIALARNFGSFAAIRVGLEHARGRAIAVMAADLQEPPELVLEMFARLRAGDADVVFGQRVARHDHWFTDLSSRAFWGLYRRFVVRDVPPGGVDIFGCTRDVAATLLQLREHHSSLVAQLFWVGYHRAFLPYERRARVHGTSAWTLRKRVGYMLDSVFAFTDLPIKLVAWAGAIGFAVSIVMALLTVIGKTLGWIEVTGYTTIVLMLAFFGSLNLLIQGTLGLYTWRTFENTKARPLAIVAQRLDYAPDQPPSQTTPPP